MRLVKAAFCLFFAALLATGCSGKTQPAAADDPRELCRFVVRGAADASALTWRDGAVQVLLPSCGRNPCFIGTRAGVATFEPDGQVRIRIGVHDVRVTGERTRPFPKMPGGAFLLGGHVAVVPGPQGLTLLLAKDPVPREVPLPVLDEREVLAAVSAVGPAVLAWTRFDEGTPEARPGRTLWLLPPDPQVLGGAPGPTFPDGQWPVFKDRALRGFLVAEGAGWAFVDTDGARVRVVDEGDPHGAVPGAGIDDDGFLFVQTMRAVRFFKDGALVKAYDVRDQELFWLDDRLYALDPARGLVALRPGGEDVIFARRPGFDLAGAPWPARSVVDRTKAIGDGQRTMVVIERAITDTCRIDDRVHVVDVAARTITTLAAGDKLRYAPAVALGFPAWVEADVTYRTVSSED